MGSAEVCRKTGRALFRLSGKRAGLCLMDGRMRPSLHHFLPMMRLRR